MNPIVKIFSCLIVSTSLLICCTSAKVAKPAAGGSEQLYMYKWVLAELDGKAVEPNSTAHLLFSPGQVNQVSGSTGCNRLTGTAVLTAATTISFSPMATTRMACMGANVETPFLAMLGKVNDWRIADKQFLLYAGDVLLAKFNGETVAAAPATSKLNGSWELNYISGPRIAFDGLYPNKKPVLVFDLPKTEVSGHTSCNPFSAPFTIDGQKISFGDGLSTMMACEGIGEPTFLKTLKQVNGYAVSDGNVLTLLIGDIAMMRFVKK